MYQLNNVIATTSILFSNSLRFEENIKIEFQNNDIISNSENSYFSKTESFKNYNFVNSDEAIAELNNSLSPKDTIELGIISQSIDPIGTLNITQEQETSNYAENSSDFPVRQVILEDVFLEDEEFLWDEEFLEEDFLLAEEDEFLLEEWEEEFMFDEWDNEEFIDDELFIDDFFFDLLEEPIIYDGMTESELIDFLIMETSSTEEEIYFILEFDFDGDIVAFYENVIGG